MTCIDSTSHRRLEHVGRSRQFVAYQSIFAVFVAFNIHVSLQLTLEHSMLAHAIPIEAGQHEDHMRKLLLLSDSGSAQQASHLGLCFAFMHPRTKLASIIRPLSIGAIADGIGQQVDQHM